MNEILVMENIVKGIFNGPKSMPKDYWFEYDGQHVELEAPTLDALAEEFKKTFDTGDIDDAMSDIPARKAPCGFGVPYERLENETAKLLRERYSDKQLYVYRMAEDGEAQEPVATFTLADIYVSIFEEREETEQGCCDGSSLALDMMRNFLIQGKWQCGLKDSKGNVLVNPHLWPSCSHGTEGKLYWTNGGKMYEPILWFGIEGEPSIDCWTLQGMLEVCKDDNDYDSEDWKSFWFSDFFMDFDILWNGDSSAEIWAFTEGGCEAPVDEFCAVRAACPIQLSADDSTADMVKKVEEYCLSKQKKCILEKTVMKAAYEMGKKLIEKIKKNLSCDEENIEDFLNKDQFMLSRIGMAFEDYMADNFFRDEKADCLEIDESLFGNEREGCHASGNNWNILDRYFKDENEVWIWVMKGWNEAFKEKYDYGFEADWLEQ